nr:hypothetical protein [Actinomycetota bacterium]
MALLDRWRRRREEEPMPDDVRAEVEAVDAALRGDPAPGGMAGLDALVRDLRAERPTPDETYAAKLDAWAAEGFDRAKRPGKTTERPAMHGIRGTPGRSGLGRRLAPAGALAATILVVAVAVSRMGAGTDDQAATGVVADQDAPVE